MAKQKRCYLCYMELTDEAEPCEGCGEFVCSTCDFIKAEELEATHFPEEHLDPELEVDLTAESDPDDDEFEEIMEDLEDGALYDEFDLLGDIEDED